MNHALTADAMRALLPPRPANAHKYAFGRVLVIAGSIQYPGAASLATAGAARVGAGLVHLAIGRSALIGPGRLAEVVLTILPEGEWGYLGEAAADELRQQFAQYQAVLLGPGIGRDESTRQFVERLLDLADCQHSSRIGFVAAADDQGDGEALLPPTVIDADGLTLLSQVPQWWERLPPGRAVLTPHPGEMRKLTGKTDLGEHVASACAAAALWQQVVVLKDHITVIAHPDGAYQVNEVANPALATAGTGDVLSGMIAGFLGQGCAAYDAARLGVFLHARAGLALADELGDAGGIASDLLPLLPLAIKALKHR